GIRTPPVTGVQTCALPTSSPNPAGWYKNDVVNRFKATDGLSGLNAACLTAFPLSGSDRVQSKTTSGEGTAVKVSSSACTDEAGKNGGAAGRERVRVAGACA